MKLFITTIIILLGFIANSQNLLPTEQKALVNVKVTNFKNISRKGEIVIFENIGTKKTLSGITKSNGKFSILIPKGSKYDIKIKDFGDGIDYSQMEIPAGEGLFTFELIIQIEPSKTYTLKNVFFDTGKATLKKESYIALNDLVEILKIKNTMEIEIAGHTDNVGSIESNIKLSKERANSVRNYLIKKGISAKRVVAKGYGETQHVADNLTIEGKQKNRRTEVRIIKE